MECLGTGGFSNELVMRVPSVLFDDTDDSSFTFSKKNDWIYLCFQATLLMFSGESESRGKSGGK